MTAYAPAIPIAVVLCGLAFRRICCRFGRHRCLVYLDACGVCGKTAEEIRRGI